MDKAEAERVLMDEVEEVECVFCGEMVDLSERKFAAQVQVLYGGMVERKMDEQTRTNLKLEPGATYKVMRKNPGKAIHWHNVCGVPDEAT